MDQFPDKLRYCRTSKQWTQENLARQIGVSLNTVQRWESGKTKPSPLAMARLKEVFLDILERDQLSLF